jgi:mono/diheme cytochrome c family protein/DNA-binding beta-propeller fold protein YncE
MSRSRYCFCIACAVVAAALAWIYLGSTPATPTAVGQQKKDKPVSFIDDVAPIFKENCFGCHGAKNPKGKLDMTRYESFRHGGTKDDPVVDGKPEESYLILALTAAHTDKKRMPPVDSGDALPKAKIDLIVRWIKEGAKLDASVKKDADLIKELRTRWKPPAPPAAYPFAVTITALAFTPDNKKLVVGGHHELNVFDATTGKLERRIKTRSRRATAMLFLPDGKLVVAGGRPAEEGDVRVYNLAAGKPYKTEAEVGYYDGVEDKAVMVAQLLLADDEVTCLALSADGKQLASGGCDRLVNVWDLSAGVDKAKKLEPAIENHADWVMSVAFSPDGKQLYTASRDKTAKVWDVANKESVLTFPDHQNSVYGVLAKADGKAGYSVGEDNQLRMWSTTGNNQGKMIRNANAHGKGAFKLVAVPKKPTIATCGGDSTVKLWNAESLAATRTLSGLTDYVYAVAASPDGSLIAAGSFNGEVRVWKHDDGALVKAFNASPGLKVEAPKK